MLKKIPNSINEKAKAERLQDEIEKEKKKKAKQKEAENYMIAAGLEKKAEISREIAAKKKKDNLDFLDDNLRKNLPKLYEDGKKLHNETKKYEKRRKDLVKLDKEDAKKGKELGFSEDKLNTLAVCALKKNQEKAIKHMTGEISLTDGEKTEIQKECKENLNSMFSDMEKNAYSKVAKEMGRSLKSFTEKFSSARDKEKAVQFSKQISDIFDVFKAKPELLKSSGLTKEELEKAKEAAYYGKSIEEGLEAIEKLAKESLEKGVEISPSEKQSLVGKITNMQTVMYIKDKAVEMDNKSALKMGGK